MTMLADERRTDAPVQDLARLRQRRRALQALRSALDVPAVPAEVVADYRPRADALAERITGRIHREVTAFATAHDPAGRAGVAIAISTAVSLFVDVVADHPTSSPAEVFGFFRQVGRAQALAGHDLDAVRAAHQLATQEAWRELRAVTDDAGLDAADASRLCDALLAFQDQLLEQTVVGFVMARRESPRPAVRGRLLVSLLAGASATEVAPLAQEVGWDLPDEVQVAAVALDGLDTRLALSRHPAVLSGLRDGVLTLVGETDALEGALGSLAPAGLPTAVSWDVPLADAGHADRWARRALRLQADGLVDADQTGVVRCAEHRRLLWIEADPALHRHTASELLEPLTHEKPAHRDSLAGTLLLWLRTRASAPALARELGVHEQTVRKRLRRLKELFGDVLADPERVTELLAALEGSAPRRRSSSATP